MLFCTHTALCTAVNENTRHQATEKKDNILVWNAKLWCVLLQPCSFHLHGSSATCLSGDGINTFQSLHLAFFGWKIGNFPMMQSFQYRNKPTSFTLSSVPACIPWNFCYLYSDKMPAPIENLYFVTWMSINMHQNCEKGKCKSDKILPEKHKEYFWIIKTFFYQPEESNMAWWQEVYNKLIKSRKSKFLTSLHFMKFF